MDSSLPRRGGGSTTDDADGTSGPPPLVQQWVKATQNTLHNLTVKRYCLPDKSVASQVLMYRQLLHTACRPGLKLSRDYTGTPAQAAVRHQPWWSLAVEKNGQVLTMVETGKMVISYDNLITRLWNTGVLRHHAASSIDTTELPPIPDDRWIHLLGFQQADPVTDFRSGGVLSLALMVWIVESCPATFARFCHGGDAQVLPFGITSINVTDLLAKLFLLSKRTDRMEALLSQKPFWQMFNDPSAILQCQQVALDILADVVVELQSTSTKTITVFDFAQILKITEHRVEYDLLGAGPVSVADLKRIYQTVVKRKYSERVAVAATTTAATTTVTAKTISDTTTTAPFPETSTKRFRLQGLAETVAATGGLVGKAGQVTGSVLSKSNEFFSKVMIPNSPKMHHHTTTRKPQPSTAEPRANDDDVPPEFARMPTSTATATTRTCDPHTEVIDFFSSNITKDDGAADAEQQQQQQPPPPDELLETCKEVDLLGGDDWVGATMTAAYSSADHLDKFQIDDDDYLL